MLALMAAVPAPEPSPIPSAPFDDLDLDREQDAQQWERRLMALAAARIAAARSRLERLGIIDAEGNLVSKELSPDMLPDSEATLETGELGCRDRACWSSPGHRAAARQPTSRLGRSASTRSTSMTGAPR
jgi:hypothetical protein